MVDYDVGDDSLVTLKSPRFRNRLMRRWLQPRLKRPFLKVKLDEIGSRVWLLCDGRKNVKEIASLLREEFKDGIEPCYDRLGLYFQQLERERFICYENLEECLKERGDHIPSPDREHHTQ